METRSKISENGSQDWRKSGVREAGKKYGVIEAFKANLDHIRSGYKIKNGDIRQVSEKDRVRKQKQIDALLEKKAILKGEVDKLVNPTTGKIHLNDEKIAKIKTEINSKLSPSDDIADMKFHPFSLADFLTYLFFIFPLSLYLILFYTSIAQSGFYGMDPYSLLDGSTLSMPIIPDFNDLLRALSTNYLLLLVPSVFFGFGLAIHIFIGKSAVHKIFILYSLFLCLLTLSADAFLAYKIHEQARLGLSIIVEPDELNEFISENWYSDPNFYIVLMMGFIVFLVWAIIFHELKVEWSKRNMILLLNEKIKRLEKDGHKYQNELAKLTSEIDVLNEKIASLERFQTAEVVNTSTLENYIQQFSDGWCDYLASRDQDKDDLNRNISEVNSIKNEFIKNLSLSTSKFFSYEMVN